MNKIQHIFPILLLLLGIAHEGCAQGSTEKKPKVMILGNVYGGGELAQVVAKDAMTAKEQLIQDADLADLFTTHADHVYTTYVHLGENSEVYGRVFGGGMGQYDSEGESAGRVTGQTDVALDGATVWSEIFGGGQMADVRGNTLVHFKKGKAGHNAYGGGLGVLSENKDANDNILADNRQTVLASADIKLIPNNYELILNDNPTNLATLKGYYNADGTIKNTSDWMTDKKTGESFVVFDGTGENYTHYEFKKARTVNRDNEGNAVKTDDLYYTETYQFDASNEQQLFSIDHNIYGGGMTASIVEGKTFVHINYGMVNQEMLDFKHNDKPVWSMIYNSIANAQFCVFGGGYGYHAQVNGDTYVTMDIEGDHAFKYLKGFNSSFSQLWDGSTDDPEKIAKAADEADYSQGAPGRSCMDIIGGGYNGKVLGSTNVTIGGDVVVRKVYGGGYYASVNETNVNIKSGLFNRVYGGGLIGNVYGKANLTFGQKGTSEDIKTHNGQLLVKDAIYGGNDVSGTVGTSDAINHTNAAGVTYHVYNPVDDKENEDNKGVRMNIYGGLVLGDVYGAGNGNHTGYGNPDYMEFSHSQHPSENYRTLAHAGEKGTNHVYKYRPRTARVVMNIQGNEGEDFNDASTIDKVRIWGRTFGGGNSCNVGVWNGEEDDNEEVYAETDSWHPGDNFTGGGTIEINIGSNVQLGNRNDSHDTPNGLFMGSNGEHMITQHLDPEKARYYHQYWDSKAEKYYPGFVVYEEDANTPIKRSVGLKAFKAFINNILTKSDNVKLNIAEDATNVWMSNFVGGGYRGSMQAATENGSFYYKLPKGVTVGHSVVGGAFNAHIIYRVYATNYGVGTYRTDTKGNYIYETIEPTDHPVKSKAEAETAGETEYDYIKKLYAEGHEGEEAYKTGYLRYNFDGGMLAMSSGLNAEDNTSNTRIHQIHNPTDREHADFTCDDGYFTNKTKALVRLELKNRLHPAVHEANQTAGTELNVHGGIVYGGCYMTGYVEGDSWVDYDCSLSPLCTDERFFGKRNKAIYDEVADLDRNNALNVFGAGYGTDTHSMGDVYVCVKATGKDTSSENGDWPFIYNVFGGGNMGTVAGSTNVYYDGGKQGTMLGSLYGGGFKGDISGNTYVELVQGFLVNVYGGSRQANINGAAHVWAYDGSTRPSTGLTPENYNHLIICNMYGGNDISGTISGTMPATWTKNVWTDLNGVGFNSYIQVSGTNPGEKGFPLVGNVYGGGNGEQWSEELGTAPNVGTSLLEINGGTTLNAFGGGNKATITGDAYIFINATGENYADVSFTEYQKGILEDKFFKTVRTGFSWKNGTELVMSPHHVDNLFGGNNVATMAIQPKWNLKAGRIGNVYSGGNMGDMTYYNADANTANGETKGLSIEVNSDDIHIESLYGGCRMSDVKAMDGKKIVEFDETEYGATVNVKKGHIGNVYGGNDISGYVYNGTNVNLSGSITGNVYGAGNGNYLYAYDKTGEHTTSGMAEVWNEEVSQNQYVYWIPGDADATPLQQLLALNKVRPHVSKAYLNLKGTNSAVGKKVYISGSVYCGGNASTIRPMTDTDEDEDAHVKFNIGNNVIVNEVFMGSNGESLKYDANGKSTYLVDFEKVNDLNLATDLEATDWTVLTNENVSNADKELVSMDSDLRKKLYPNLLSIYMRAVDMKAMPRGFDIGKDEEGNEKTFTNTWIGTFCMGGNAGSMMVNQPVDIVFPQSLNFFGRIIGGCKDASFQYNGKWHRGGFRMPLASDAELDDAPTKTKLRMKIRGDWYSRRMVIDEDDTYRANDYLAPDKTNDGEHWDPAGKAWHDGCNVYGGCYQSGDMVGDVQIFIESDMLAYSDSRYGMTIDNYTNNELVESNKLNIPVANVYGAGFGPDSRSFGDAYIYMKDIPNVASHHPSVNNIFGGGRNGMLVGNSVIHIHDGLVFKDVVGGSFAASMYGSSQVTVGYPKFYVCKQTGEYFLDRADKWNEEYLTKGNNKTESVIKTSIKYFEGTYVPCNVYEQITDVIVYDHDTPRAKASIKEYLQNNKEKTNDYFEFHNEYDDSNANTENFFPKNGWNDVEIRVRGGVYGGGFSLSNSTTAIAGSYTTLASTEDYNHGVDSKGNSSVGFGGNSSIIITDQGTTKDHIKISTENPVANGVYSGTGGIYGDGRLVFCEGFRAAELNGYGYAEHTPKNPLMLNSLQRLDLLTVNDCCFKLYGDQDFATDELNSQKYSLARIGELRMNSTINSANTYATGELTTAKSRNYIGFYNNIHYLGSIVTNDDFHTSNFHDATGAVDNGNTYRSKKQEYITNYHGSTNQGDIDAFKQRNYATARNMVGINSGYCLRVENQYYEGNNRKTYYGPIVGVAEIKLLNVQPGEGGGYVYADNIHDTDNPTFMNESGNFVFEGVQRPGEGEKQFIVDDCLPKGFDEIAPSLLGKAGGEALPEQHYWYVIGDTYYYNTTLTAFSYNGEKQFNLTNSDANVIFAGIEKDSEVSLQSVKWQTATYPNGYTGDIRGGRDTQLAPLSGEDTYKFTLQVGDETSWSEELPRSTADDTEALPGASATAWKTYTTADVAPNPRFNVHLLDNVNNCPPNREEEYFNNHLSVPERVQLVIKARKGDETKTYNVTLEIVYIQGPSFTGNVNIMNCALPGERIGFNSKDIQVKTTEQLPVTDYGWKLVPLTSESSYTWNEANGINIPASYYHTTAEGYLQGSIPALYSQNHWNILYTFTVGGETFTVAPTTDEEKPINKRMLVVHNYHKMADIATKYDVALAPIPDGSPSGDAAIYAKALKPGAMIYLADAADIAAFVNYVNDGNATEGMHFYLQNDLTLPAAITGAFAGTLHGNGYSLTLPTNGGSLFGANFDKEHAKVYNLGVPNGTIATVSGSSPSGIINCFSKADDADELKYGKKAYALSHFFKTTDSNDGYVHTLFANNDGMGGDWRYARTESTNTRYLRTAAPNYGYMQTNHNTKHDDNYSLAEHDCLFFGQELKPDAAKKHPEHIDEEFSVNVWTEANRVYRTTGYYQSTTADKFHYNKVAWAMQPTLTAIDFTAENASGDFYGKTDDRPASLTSFNSDHNGTGSPYSNATTGKVTQNLLVYNSDNGNAVFKFKDLSTTTEEDVQYHNILLNSTYGTNYLHLVDKQDFCAPIAFNVAQRAWYERKPAHYAESNNDAWEGICLPFTVHKVEAETNGEITHFYGVPGLSELNDDETEVAADFSNVDPAKNFHTLHHEYWLRGLTDVATANDKTTATFQRPGANGENGLFRTDAQASAAFDYTYTINRYLTNLSGYNKTDNDWYTDEHTFEGYKPLTANTPYIVSFPGSRFYEFDLNDQTITFTNNDGTIIPVTGTIATAKGGYTHTGTFLHVANAQYGMNYEGTAFDENNTGVLPFRTYITATSNPSRTRSIIIGGTTETIVEVSDAEHGDPTEGEVTDKRMVIYGSNHNIIIESPHPTSLCIYSSSGQLVRAVNVYEGKNIYPGFAAGIYIINGQKLLMK